MRDVLPPRVRTLTGVVTLRLRFEVVGKHSTEVRGGYNRPARDLPARTPLRLVLDRALAAPAVTPEQVARWKAWALARADAIDPVLSGQVLTHLHVPALDD